jgi:hypothetical protein
VSLLQSAKTGFAPVWTTTLAVAEKVIVGTITSSPAFIPIAIKERCNPAVQEFNANAYFVPLYDWNIASSFNTFEPVPNQPLLREDITSSISGCSIRGLPKAKKSLRIPIKIDYKTVLSSLLSFKKLDFIKT